MLSSSFNSAFQNLSESMLLVSFPVTAIKKMTIPTGFKNKAYSVTQFSITIQDSGEVTAEEFGEDESDKCMCVCVC